MDLFDRSDPSEKPATPPARAGGEAAPLADRMRPAALEDFLGQDAVVGPDTPLRRAIDRDRIPSMILWGPPGSGKTTLAHIIARHTRAHFAPFSAVLSGVKEVRAIVDEAARRLRATGQRTILFVDEIHRFNRSQQDAFLPHVEAGTIVLIGATTENPSFELNAALLSRAKVIVLKPLEPPEIRRILDRAAGAAEGAEGRVEPEALDYLADWAQGDARRALNALEVALEGAPVVTRAWAEEVAGRHVALYDKVGEAHYNVTSAFIKSLRGSDPDAALYWMARMLDGGEDPLFVLRRMVIFAAEDVGLADPRALSVAVAAQQAFSFVGMPEGYLPLSQACLYLALAPKSNSAIASYGRALEAVKEGGQLPVPERLRNAPTALMRSLGYARGYRYPHAYEGHYVAESYLPEDLEDTKIYAPSDQGEEPGLASQWRERRGGAEGNKRDD